MALETGTRLGPYEIVLLLGKGGMGEVYRARDTRLDRDVAVKVIPADLSEDETYRKRLEREAKTIAQLQHPNVCMLLDIGSEDTTQYLVMEYLEGETLEDRLQKGALPVDDVLQIGGEIAEALEAAHRAGVVHRDLKPGNLMLTKTGTKVLDFGLAREFASPGVTVNTQAATVPAITREGTLVGTMPYMAPEQLQGGQADSRTDIWALGCVLYEMTTGHRPFQGDSKADLIVSIMGSDPNPPSREQPLAPDRLNWVIKRCLAKRPEDRWQSARDLGIELGGMQSGESAPPPESAPAPAAPTRSAFVWRTALAATVLASLVIAVVWWVRRPTPIEENTPVGMDAERMAVLPFDNLSNDPTLDSLAFGLADEVIDSFTNIWPVVARTTSFAYAGTPVCDAAEQMRVRYILEGSVRKAGDQIRIAAKVISCPEEDNVWSESWHRSAEDDLALQEDVAHRITHSSLGVVWRNTAQTEGSPYSHLEAKTPRDNALSLVRLTELAGQEKTSVRAYYGISLTHLQALLEGYTTTDAARQAAIEGMAAAAERCLDLEPQSYTCLNAAAFHALMAGEGESAIRYYRRSAEVRSVWRTRALMANALGLMGRSEEAVEQLHELIESAESADAPEISNRASFDTVIAVGMANARFVARNYSDAIEWTQRGIDTGYMRFERTHLFQMQAVCYAHMGRYEEAGAALTEARQERPGLTIEWADTYFSIASAETREHYKDGLQKAGL